MNGKELIKFILDNDLENKEIALSKFTGEESVGDLYVHKRDNDQTTIHSRKVNIRFFKPELHYDSVSPNLRRISSEIDNLTKKEIKYLIGKVEEIAHGHVGIENFQDMSVEERNEFLAENNIVLDGVTGIEIEFNKFGKDNHSVRLLVEDDGNLFRTDFIVSHQWLDSTIKACEKAKIFIKKEKII